MVVDCLRGEADPDDERDRLGETREGELPPDDVPIQRPAWQFPNACTRLFWRDFRHAAEHIPWGWNRIQANAV